MPKSLLLPGERLEYIGDHVYVNPNKGNPEHYDLVATDKRSITVVTQRQNPFERVTDFEYVGKRELRHARAARHNTLATHTGQSSINAITARQYQQLLAEMQEATAIKQTVISAKAIWDLARTLYTQKLGKRHDYALKFTFYDESNASRFIMPIRAEPIETPLETINAVGYVMPRWFKEDEA